MASIMVMSKNDCGDLALKKHFADSLRASWKDRQAFKLFYDEQQWMSPEGRLCLTLTIKNKALAGLLDVGALAKPISDTMKLNGATKDVDYELSVKA